MDEPVCCRPSMEQHHNQPYRISNRSTSHIAISTSSDYNTLAVIRSFLCHTRTMGSSDDKTAKVLKIAKKTLKRKDSKTLKAKKLAQTVADQLHCPDSSHDDILAAIANSPKFQLDGKHVSLKKKKLKSDKKRELDQPINITVSVKKGKTTVAVDQNSADKWRSLHKVMLKANGVDSNKHLEEDQEYFPFASFESPGLVRHAAQALLRQCTQGNGFTTPTPIQAAVWPLLFADGEKRRDLIGLAKTGSGKTLAFSLPALSAMSRQTTTGRKSKLPKLAILAPTRELAMQSHDVMAEFGSVVGLKSLVLYGGVPKQSQRAELRKGVDCVVATPGRLQDLIQEGNCDLSDVQYLVLDEADRMLDMGFEEAVRFIISNCKPKEAGRQTMMFSATWPAEIQKISLQYMNDPVRVYVGFESVPGSEGNDVVDDSLAANKSVSQTVEVIEDRERERRLRELLQKHHGSRTNRILVFALYKKEAERLEYSLRRDGWNCCSIHGNKNQAARTAALAEFKAGTCPLLVATDVAARGLDIPNVEMVVNYSFPLTIEDYVHRIGRTGRAGKLGQSHTFFQSSDKLRAGELQKVMRDAGQAVPEELMKFGSTIKKKEHSLYGNFGPRDGHMKKAVKIRFDG